MGAQGTARPWGGRPRYCGAMAGRQTKLTPAVQKRIVTMIRKGTPRGRAAELAGVHQATFFRWMAEGDREEEGIHREFREAVLRAEAELIERACAAVVDAFEQDEDTGAFRYDIKERIAAARFILPHRFPQDFSTRQEVRQTGHDGGPVKVEAKVQPVFTDAQLAAMSPEQLEAALAGLALPEGE